MLISDTGLVWPLLPAAKPNAEASDAQWAQAQTSAVEWLWAQSGRRYGIRRTTYRPQGLHLSPAYWGAVPYLVSIYGSLWGEGCGRGDGLVPQVLQLPGPCAQPAGDSPLTVDLYDATGVHTLLSSTDVTPSVRLDGDYLVRLDGGTWPTTQDLISNAGAANTWQVTYSRGVPVPVGGQVAAGALAAEWLNMVLGRKDACKLPWNTVSASRSGVTVQLQASLAYRTSGIAAVDRWVSAVNPAGIVTPPRVWSPDVARNQQPYRGSSVPYRSTFGGL